MRVPGIFNPRWFSARDERGHRRLDTLFYLGKTIVHDFLTFNIPHMAASIAFWGFFSMFPMVLGIVLIGGGILSYDSFIERVGDALPISQDFITETLKGVTTNWPYTGTVAALGLVWASLAVFSAIRKGLNAAWGITKPRPFFRERLIDFSLMLGAWLVFVISLSITPIIEFSRNTPQLGRVIFWDGAWVLLRSGLPLVLTFMAFSSLYRYIPNTQVRWRDVWPGAVVAAISFEVLRNGFVWYVASLSIYNLVYGTAATMIVLLAWAYFSGVILLFGAVISSRLNKLRKLRGQASAANGTSSHLDVDMLVLTRTSDDD
ncbi:MAG: YihY/virulence factor BrkB family protein [Chloroflexi bacterium]|nr:YihY/virulence factor BrkB family protein [Chloroflexota bacterium]